MKFNSGIRKKPIYSRFSMAIVVTIFIICFSVLLSAQELAGKTEIISENVAITRALQRSSLSDKWRGQIQSARAQTREAGAWDNPQFDVTRERFLDETSSGAEDSFVIEQSLPFSNHRRLSVAQAQLDIQSLELRIQSERNDIIYDVQQAFYKLLYAQLKLDAFDRAFDDMSDAIMKVELLVNSGESSRYELERLLREKDEILAQRDIALSLLERHQIILRGWVSASSESSDDRSFQVIGELLPSVIPDEAIVEEAVKEHPVLHLAQVHIGHLKRQRELASTWWIPDISLRGGIKTQAHASGRSWGYVAGLSMAIPMIYQNQGQRQELDAQLIEITSRYDLNQRTILSNSRGILKQLRRLQSTATGYKENAVQRADRIVMHASQSYDAGEGSILELIDAHQGLLNAKLTELELAWQCRQKYLELNKWLFNPQYIDTIIEFSSNERK